MTNIGMVLPQTGYWAAAQKIIKNAGTLLVMDETHTISSGVAGYAALHKITPDAMVLGKPIGGGIACAVYGFSKEVAEQVEAAKRNAPAGHSGIGTTLTANMLTMAVIRANLSQVMTQAAYQTMLPLAEQLAAGLRAVIAKHHFAWCVTQVGARVEFQFCPTPPINGTQADAILDGQLEKIIHLYLLNRGILITPFHNMMLICPATTTQHIAQFLAVFDTCLAQLSN